MGKNKKKSKKQDDSEETTKQPQKDAQETEKEIDEAIENSKTAQKVIESNGAPTLDPSLEGPDDKPILEKLQQAEKERDEIKHSYDNLVSRLSSFKSVFANMKKAEVELEEKSELVDKLNEENDRLKEENIDLKSSLNEASNKVDHNLYKDLQEQNANLNNECEKLSDTLTKTRREYTSTIEELQDEKYSLENENSKLSKLLHELKQEVSDLTVAQSEFDQEKKDMADSVNVFKDRFEAKNDEVKSAHAKIEELNNLLSTNNVFFEKEKLSLLAKIEALEEKLAEKDNTIETLGAEVESFKQKSMESELKSTEIADLKKEINNKQLLIGKLRHEAVILNEHLTKALTMMKQKGEGSNKTVDAELLSNVIISFLQFPRGDSKKFEALQLISALLEWDQLQKIAAGLQHVPNAKGGKTKVDSNGNEVPTRQSFVSLWTEFLEKESSDKSRAHFTVFTMVNIQDFFKNQQGKSGTKRKAEETESPSAKRTKPTAMESKPKVIELDDDFEFDDDDDDDILEIEPPKKASPKKKQPEASSKKPQGKQSTTKKETKPQSSEPMGGESIDAVLAKIPDAELPEVNEGEKPNFFALKAQQNVTASTLVDLPAAQPNCLTGLTIVFTGQMPSLDRNTAELTAQQYGAKVTKSISKKTSLVVIGSDAGPSKVKKIREFKIKAIDEAGFIQLLSSMPADGGSGEAAVKAKEKREQEERKIIEEAERAEKEERNEEERKRRRAQATASQSVSNGISQIPPATQDVPAKDRLWTDKHAPKDFNQLCGNKGQVQKLRNWLEHWFENKARNFSGGPENPGSYRAALISGPPGIGKTTAAHMVANSLGFDVLEKNASDVRSKSLLNANIKSVLSNTSVIGFFKHRDDEQQSSNSKKLCLIMDEVDGMSSGDHGGAGALSQFCRITNMPMILICNDKSLPKMRTFDRVTYDLPFRRPTENEVKSRLMTIALREGIKLDPNIIGQLVQATSNDIRQMINLLSTVSKTQKLIGANNVKEIQASWKKQIILKPFDIAGRLLSSGLWSGPNQNLNEKLDLYFNDIDFAPLMIQENYLNTRLRLPGSHIKHVAQAADDISLSDSINSLIRSSEQQWSLLPFHGLMSTVKPSYEVAGQVTGRLNFSAWLGQNSKQMKYQRMLQELQYHTRVKTSTTKQELRLDYLNPLWVKLNIPIKQQGEAGIDQTIETMDAYYLTKEDYDNISDILNKPIDLDKKDKTAFTRKYNNAIHPTVIYKTGNSFGAGSKRTTPAKVDYEDVVEDDMEDIEDDNDGEESDKIDAKKDKLIKQVPVGKGGAAKRLTKGPVKRGRGSKNY